MNKKHKIEKAAAKRVSLKVRPVRPLAIAPTDPMVAPANATASPAPRQLTPGKLAKLAKKMCAAKNPKSAEKLRVEFMEGFYGRRFLPEELHFEPRSREAIAGE